MVFWLSRENFLMSSTDRKWKRLLETGARPLAPLHGGDLARTRWGVVAGMQAMAGLLHPGHIQKKAPGCPSAVGGRADLWHPSRHPSTPTGTSVFIGGALRVLRSSLPSVSSAPATPGAPRCWLEMQDLSPSPDHTRSESALQQDPRGMRTFECAKHCRRP